MIKKLFLKYIYIYKIKCRPIMFLEWSLYRIEKIQNSTNLCSENLHTCIS